MRISDWSSDVCSSDLSGSSTVKYQGIQTDPNVRVIGGDEDWPNASGYEIGQGRNFSANEINYANSVAIIGSDISQRVFGDKDPIDKVIAIGANRFKVIGVFSRSEEHTSELQSLMRISYAVFCLKKKTNTKIHK